MSPADIAVLVIGVALIAGELWFFLGPRARGAGPVAPADRSLDHHQHG